jgi:hypothetical protein
VFHALVTAASLPNPILPLSISANETTMVDSVPPEYAKYSWRVSDADPSAYARHGMGVDRLLHLFKDRMFLGVDLSFANPLSRGDLLVAARKAWITLRFQEPVVASSMNTTVDDDLLMVYHLVTDPSTLEAWAERTVELTEASTLADARTKIDQRRPETPDAHNDQTFLHIVPRGSDKEYTIVLYGTHVPYDGAGYQAIMTRYLRHLARYAFDRTLVEKEHAALRWGEEAKNLPPPYFEVVAKSEPLNGPVFNQALASSLQAFGVVAVRRFYPKHGTSTLTQVCRQLTHGRIATLWKGRKSGPGPSTTSRRRRRLG